LSPPLVEPAQPPTHMMSMSSILLNSGQLSKSAVAKPVVLDTLISEKTTSRRFFPQEE